MNLRLRPAAGLVSALVAISIVTAACSGTGASPSAAVASAPSAAASAGSGSGVGAPPADSAFVQKVKAAGKIRFGVAVGIPWLGKDPATNEYFGSAKFMAEKVAAALGVTPEYVEQTYANQIPALQSDRIDLIVAPLYTTEERLKVVDMTPYAMGGFCYLLKKDNTTVDSLDDLNSESVIMANGEGTGTLAETSKKYPKAKQLTRFAEVGEVAFVQEVLSGRATVAPVDNTTAQAFADKYDLKVLPDDCYNNPDIPTPVAAAYAKGDAAFKTWFDAYIASIRPEIDAESEKFLDVKYVFPEG